MAISSRAVMARPQPQDPSQRQCQPRITETLPDRDLFADETAADVRVPPVVTPEVQQILDNSSVLDNSPSELMRNECIGCALARTKLITTKGFTRGEKDASADAIQLRTRRAFKGGSIDIYDDAHPAIKAHNEFFSRLEALRAAKTVSMAATSAKRKQHDADGPKAQSGVYLVKRVDVDGLQRDFTVMAEEVKQIEARLNRDRDEILAMAREMLGSKFNPDDYPATFQIGFSWSWPSVDVPSYLAQLAPAAYAHEQRRVDAQFEQTWELAVSDMLTGFQAVIGSWVDALGPVVRIYPTDSHAAAKYHGAEVYEKKTHADDETIPEGQLVVTVRFYPPGKKTLAYHTFEPMTEADYKGLQPSEIAADREKKTFKDSTVDNLLAMVQKFNRFGPTLRTSGDFDKLVKDIETHLAQCNTTKEAAQELRDSTTFRRQTHALMAQLQTKVGAEITTFKTMRRVDRKKTA